MSKLFKVGDLVSTHRGYHPSSHFICRIMNITDQNNIDHNEYNIITGCGDKNSKLKVTLKIIAYKEDSKLDIFTVEPFIKEEENMHNLFLIDVESTIKNNIKKSILLEKQNDFYKKFRNRQEKIDIILDATSLSTNLF